MFPLLTTDCPDSCCEALVLGLDFMRSNLGEPEGVRGQFGGAQRVHAGPGAQEGLFSLAVRDSGSADRGGDLTVPTRQPR